MTYPATLLLNEFVTHDVRRLLISRPPQLRIEAGQAVELALDEQGWRERTRPFTPTALDSPRLLEFTIKAYPEHNGVTAKLHTLQPGATLTVSDPFGAIRYRGPGTFIAAGAGITPFIAILRELAREGRLDGHQLLFSNKTPADRIAAFELSHLLGDACRFLCTRETDCNCERGRISREFLEQHITDFGQNFYVCGPPHFTESITASLVELGASPQALVFDT